MRLSAQLPDRTSAMPVRFSSAPFRYEWQVSNYCDLDVRALRDGNDFAGLGLFGDSVELLIRAASYLLSFEGLERASALWSALLDDTLLFPLGEGESLA